MEMERTGGIPRIVICLCQFEGMLYRVPRITYLFNLPMTSAAPQWLRQTYFDNLVAPPQIPIRPFAYFWHLPTFYKSVEKLKMSQCRATLCDLSIRCAIRDDRSKSSKCHNAVKMCNFVESGI